VLDNWETELGEDGLECVIEPAKKLIQPDHERKKHPDQGAGMLAARNENQAQRKGIVDPWNQKTEVGPIEVSGI